MNAEQTKCANVGPDPTCAQQYWNHGRPGGAVQAFSRQWGEDAPPGGETLVRSPSVPCAQKGLGEASAISAIAPQHDREPAGAAGTRQARCGRREAIGRRTSRRAGGSRRRRENCAKSRTNPPSRRRARDRIDEVQLLDGGGAPRSLRSGADASESPPALSPLTASRCAVGFRHGP